MGGVEHHMALVGGWRASGPYELAWRPIDALASDSGIDDSLRRMARAWLARG